jgi:preprotein translocase subunit SecD
LRHVLDAASPTPVPGHASGHQLIAEAPRLTPALTRSFNAWNCLTDRNPTGGRDHPGDDIIACDATTKYLLAPAAVEGNGISGASAGLDTTNQWVVNLSFHRRSAHAWLELTKHSYAVDGGRPDLGSCAPPKGCNAVAITLDGVVQSAPDIIAPGGIPGGQAQISGSFTRQQANDLATVLEYGSLPTTFRIAM